MNEYFIDQKIKDLIYDLEIERKKCFCGKGEIVKIKTYELTKCGKFYGMREVKKVKNITCEYCEENYDEIQRIDFKLDKIREYEKRLADHKYSNLSKEANKEKREERDAILKEYEVVKSKLNKFNLISLPYYSLTKHQWATYFVENKLTDLDEKQCYKQLFYGSDKIGFEVFLKTVGITAQEYTYYLRGKSISQQPDVEKELKDRILEYQEEVACNKELVELLMEHKSKLSNWTNLKTLEVISKDFDRIIEERNKKREEEWELIQKERKEVYKLIEEQEEELDEDTLSSDFYDKSDLAFHIEEALNYTLNKIINDKNLISSEEDKKTFIKEYICDTLGDEYIPNDTFQYDDDEEYEDDFYDDLDYEDDDEYEDDEE